MIASLGSAGLGLVWGWSIVLVSGRRGIKRPLYNVLWLVAATLLISLQVYWHAGWRGLALYLGAGAFSAFLHLVWREDLRKGASFSSRIP